MICGKNSQGMTMVRIEAGSFSMGGGSEDMHYSLPKHRVTFSEDYWISAEPVTVEQYLRFRQDKYGDSPLCRSFAGYVQGISYFEAQEYTQWLSGKENKSYHLPTEAQWEYAARNSIEFGIDRMCDMHIREWCYDWYAPYPEEEQTDPAGPVNGNYRIVRGGFLDNPKRYDAYHLQPYYRCALPPGYCHDKEDHENLFGCHPIGFRVVLGPEPIPAGEILPPYLSVAVRQDTEDYRLAAPREDVPYFRKRYLFPVPPDNCTREEIETAGFGSFFRHHHHSPGFTACETGDLLFSVYSTYHEYDAESGLAGCRLRAGADQWEFPDEFLDPVGVNDHAPLFYTDKKGVVYHFWGWPQLPDAYPFQYVESHDNGETWSEVRFPRFVNQAQRLCAQPVNTCVEGRDGTFYLVSDATSDGSREPRLRSSSVLWRSRDGMKTWENPKGRTYGRHTTAVELEDGSILALGGKNTDINGYMPVAVTSDGGDSYDVYPTPFPTENSGQRPCILRLFSGKLVVCGDYQTKKNYKPEALKDRRGSYVAWSDDEGRTWTFKQLWGAQPRKKNSNEFGGETTLGYSVMRQSPDGLIHIVCSNVQPLLHLCFNEAWLTGPEREEPPEEELMKSAATRLVSGRKEYCEYYPDGHKKCRYFGGIADDGRFLLDGPERFWYPDGNLMWKAEYELGQKVGEFVYYDRTGNPVKRILSPEKYPGRTEERFETFWPGTGLLRTSAYFVNRKAQGEACMYDKEGNVIHKAVYSDGKITDDYTLLEK